TMMPKAKIHQPEAMPRKHNDAPREAQSGAKQYGLKLPCTPASSSTTPSRLSAEPKLKRRPVSVRNMAIRKPRPDRAITVARPTISMPQGSSTPVTEPYAEATSAEEAPRLQKIPAARRTSAR